MRDDFCVFILTHGRARNVITYKTLERQGYTGKLYIVIDNEDDQENEYRKIFGDKVLQFDKLEVAKTFDTMDLSEERRTIVYARNVCFDLAKQVGCRYFLELDDDYVSFMHRSLVNGKLIGIDFTNLDETFEAMLEFLDATQADTVAFAQGGDYIGGKDGGNFKKKVLRKVMNTFFCDTEKPFKFIGRINEDVNTYTRLGSTGWLGLTITDACIVQKQTQTNSGGMSTVYNESGTFLKSFYTVMIMPSAVVVADMGGSHRRIHHKVFWDRCVPKILNERYRKAGDGDGKKQKG